jgi:hypothetical protein
MEGGVGLDGRWLPNGEDWYIVDLIYMLIGWVRQDEHDASVASWHMK